MDKLFTFVADYKGGTYIVQFESGSLYGATSLWRQFGVRQIAELSGTAVSMFDSVALEEAVAIAECRNAWCASDLIDDSLLLVNIIETAT